MILLKNISCNMESKPVSMNFLYFVTIKSICLSSGERLFYWVWFYNRLHWSFGKYRFVCYSYLPNVDRFHYTTPKKITFLNITTLLIRKVLGTSKLSNSQWQMQFFKNLIFFESSNPIAGNNYCQLFTLT